jgi:PAS domain S-box-containing protein
VRTPYRPHFPRGKGLHPLARLRNASFWVPFAVAAVGIASSLVTWHVNQTLPRDRRAQNALRQIALDAGELQALESRFLKAGKAEASDTLVSNLLLNDMATQTQALSGLDRAPDAVVAVQALMDAFRELSPATGALDWHHLNLVHQSTYLPARVRLLRIARGANHEASRRLDVAEKEVEAGMIFSAFVAVLLIATLATRVKRVHARETQVARQAERDLSERDDLLVDSQKKLKAAERGYRDLVERLPGMTYISDPFVVKPSYISPQAIALLGRPAAEFVARPQSIIDVMHPDDRAGVQTAMAAIRRTGGEHVQQFRVVHPDGRVAWVEDHAKVVAGDEGDALQVQGYLTDVTLLKEAAAKQEAALDAERAANEKLRELGALKDDFVALVSHELRTPLTSIRGYLELLLQNHSSSLNVEGKGFLDIVERNSLRLERLVNDLLFMAHLGSGRLELTLEETDLAALVREAVDAATPRASARSITFECVFEDVPLIRGDPGRLGQLFDNLISNAVKFTAAGSHVDVRVVGEGEHVAIEVADTGIGISAEDQPQLFEMFFRTAAATEQAIQGTGLGLAISKAIVQAHGGTIDLVSEEHVGTTVRVVLPVAAEAGSA